MRHSRALGSSVTLSKSVAFGSVVAIAAMVPGSGMGVDNPRTIMAVLNDTDQPVYLFLSGDNQAIIAGTVKPTVKLAAGQYWEDPGNYQGEVRVSHAGTPPTTGSVNFTEWL